MSFRSFRLLGNLVFAAALTAPSIALGQDVLTDRHDLTHCSVVGVLAGVSITPQDVSPTLGGMVGWPFTGRFGMEAGASWVRRPHGGSSMAAAVSFRHNFTGREGFVPYVKGGVGVYLERLDTSRATPPAFYARRLRAPAGIDGNPYTFIDPAVVLGGGTSWFVSRRVAIRPEVESFIVIRGANARTVTSARAYLEFHFEDARVAP